MTRRLNKAFKAHRVELIGSFKRDTAIRGVSDIDLMLILSSKEVIHGFQAQELDQGLKHVRERTLAEKMSEE